MTLPDYYQDPAFAGHHKVLEVLRRWDPIGVIREDHQDEYDGYAPTLMNLLDRGATAEELLQVLRDLATGHMGLSTFDEAHSRSCAEELAAFWRSWKDR